ncbi:MAG TPA: ribosome-binding factor A [Patescibacteria group bacterium]|nr:ribosome-binding factor A [Patescibacteria group bacterium]
MPHRLPQMNELIRQELNSLILTEVEFPKNCLVTITKVETAKDLRYSKVWFSVMPFVYAKKVLTILRNQIGHLQFLLNKKLSMRPLPRLNFAIDDTEKKAADIDALLDRLKDSE